MDERTIIWLRPGALHTKIKVRMLPALSLPLTSEDAPVLDYSGGVGNNILALAMQGIRAGYFGIAIIEYSFTQFRVANRKLSHLVDFYLPYVADTGSEPHSHFNPARAIPNKQFGALLLYDVLEHIPNYHYTLAHLTTTLRIGGRIFESSPFDTADAKTTVHLPASKPMLEVMTVCGLAREEGWWRKISNGDIPSEWLQ